MYRADKWIDNRHRGEFESGFQVAANCQNPGSQRRLFQFSAASLWDSTMYSSTSTLYYRYSTMYLVADSSKRSTGVGERLWSYRVPGTGVQCMRE